MIDRKALQWLSPWLDRLAAGLAARGVRADALTLTGFALGLLAAGLIAAGQPLAALLPLLASRLCDGLDGAVARRTQPTDRGAFLDIALDFLFYASIPLAFAIADPAANALAAAGLLAAFIGTGSSFLAFAVLAERRGLRSTAYPRKGFFFLGGLTEGGETLLCFVAMCLWPQAFALLAFGFALLCGLTIATRLWAGWRLLEGPAAARATGTEEPEQAGAQAGAQAGQDSRER
ncbi:MAG: CDP-alcohol phosphatidyltransferase family protein [Rubrivivax sp.]|nr:CDP-alcohol phosphatidyltransferase family protein [Rubrivivax sp.]